MTGVAIEATRSPRRGEDRRRLLIEAAFRVIAEQGFEGLRLRAVAAGAGIDHSTLHHYFPTRQDLVAAVVKLATRQFWTTMPAAGTAAATLTHHLRTLALMMAAHPGLFRVLREIDLRASRDPAVGAIVSAYEQGWRTALAEVLPTERAVDLLIATVKGISLHPERADEVLGELAALLTKEHP